jgi:hypothetical protein
MLTTYGRISLVALLFGLPGFVGCSAKSAASSDERPLRYERFYNSNRENLYILGVIPDENLYFKEYGEHFEMLHLGGSVRSLRGWTLKSGSTGKSFPLKDSVLGTLVVVTQPYPREDKIFYSLNHPEGIWANDRPDSAMIFDDSGELVDKFVFGFSEPRKPNSEFEPGFYLPDTR